MKRTMQRYDLVRVRAKISYMAFLQRKTIPELICNAIIDSHKLLTKEQEIPVDDINAKERE